jgi:hypothetical protein
MSTRTIRTLTWLLVGTIAVIAFAVSFEAISQYAVEVGAFPRSLRYCAPLLVDAFTVAAGLVILARARDGVRAVYAWTLVAVASGVSVALNVAHAPHNLAAQLVAALPPAALLASLELVLSEARRSRSAQPPAPDAEAPTTVPAQPALAGADLTGQSTDNPAVSGTVVGLDTATSAHEAVGSRVVVRTLLAADQDVPVEAVMERAGIGRRRAYELLRQERAAMNGSRS